MQLLKKSSIKVVLFFSVIILVFLCMNCNFDHGYDTALNGQAEQPSSSNHNIDSIGSQFNPDSFSWDNVVFLNGGVVVNQDISGWSQTSEVLSASLSTRGVCVDHTQRTVWHSEINPGYNQLPDPWQMQGSIWIFIPRPDGKIYAAAFEGLRSRNNKPGQSAATGTECVLGYKGYDIAGVISYLVDKTKAIHLTGPNERAAFNPIQDWYPQPEDVLGFAVSTWAKNPADYRSGHRNERSDVVWIRVPDYNTSGGSGDVVSRSGGGSSGTGEGGGSSGRPSVVCGQCSDTKNKCTRGVFHSHPPDTDDQYLWTCRNIPHRSDPRCDDGVDDDHRQIGCHKTKTGDERISAGPACTSKQRYPHYKTLKGKCLPSCGHAANMAGYGGKGSDGIARTSDDPHVYASRGTSCSSVVRFGNDDWKDFSWVDKYTLRAMNSRQIKEVATSGGVCCVRGRPKNPTTPKVVPRTTKRTGGGSSGSSNGGIQGESGNFSDFDFSKVTWLHTNVSGWEESSRITSVEVKVNGQICINDTQRGQWPAGNPLGGGPLDGNPWVIVKINGRYYAGTYEWLRPGQICKFGHSHSGTAPLSKVYNNAWGGHIKVSPLKEWVPRAGEIVGFMISGIARNNRVNVRKRTNVQFYRLPDTNGRGGAMLGSYSSSR